MSLARAVAGSVLQDALLPAAGGARAEQALRLELPGERLLAAAAVAPPLLLASLAFARDVAAGPPVRCFAPANFTAQQAAFADAACWEALEHRGADTESLWVLKVLPYALLAAAALLCAPHALWRRLAVPPLRRDLLLVLDELHKSYNRAVRLVQHVHRARHTDADGGDGCWREYERAHEERYFEFPLLERYLARKQRSRRLAALHVLRYALLLLLLAAASLSLLLLAGTALRREEFACAAVPPARLRCRLAGAAELRRAALAAAGTMALLAPAAAWHALRLRRGHAALLAALRLLPALQGLPPAGACSDLGVLLLWLRHNAERLPAYGRLRAARALRPCRAGDAPPPRSLVDVVALLAGLEPPPARPADEPKAKMEIEENGTRDSLGSG